MLPGQFRVVDADTIWCLSDQRGPKGKEMSFSLRFRSIAAPERVKGRPTDKILQAAGIDPYSDHPGRMATEALRAFCDRRAVMVIPSGEQDRYGRSLVDMAVIPMKDGKFNPEDAVSLERLMIHKRVVDPFRDEELPKLYPQPNQSPDFSM
jgi:endonuclease YncB( thermonuclease family)